MALRKDEGRFLRRLSLPDVIALLEAPERPDESPAAFDEFDEDPLQDLEDRDLH